MAKAIIKLLPEEDIQIDLQTFADTVRQAMQQQDPTNQQITDLMKKRQN